MLASLHRCSETSTPHFLFSPGLPSLYPLICTEIVVCRYGQSLYGGMVVASLAWPSQWVLLVGSFLSTFGAALQCLCSAPRLLQSIAKDDVIPILRPFAKVTKKNEVQPFVALALFYLYFSLLTASSSPRLLRSSQS